MLKLHTDNSFLTLLSVDKSVEKISVKSPHLTMLEDSYFCIFFIQHLSFKINRLQDALQVNKSLQHITLRISEKPRL